MDSFVALLTLVTGINSYPNSPTYTKDIRPIFKNRCSSCHDYLGDKNWQVYENAYKYKDQIKMKILTKEMPQGKDMPQSERDLIVEWVNEGARK